MDPVCMLTIYPQLLQNFVYKPPRMKFNVIGLVDSLRFVFSRDLLVAEVRLLAEPVHTGPHASIRQLFESRSVNYVVHGSSPHTLAEADSEAVFTLQAVALMGGLCLLSCKSGAVCDFLPLQLHALWRGAMRHWFLGLDHCHSVLQSFCRKFVWHRECLWPEELPKPCLLVLAAEDDLVPSKLLRQLLQSINHPCEVGIHCLPHHQNVHKTCWDLRLSCMSELATVLL